MGRSEKTSWFKALEGGALQKSVLQSVFITLITWFAGPTPAAAQYTGSLPFGPPIVHVTDAPFGGISAAAAVIPDERWMDVTDVPRLGSKK